MKKKPQNQQRQGKITWERGREFRSVLLRAKRASLDVPDRDSMDFEASRSREPGYPLGVVLNVRRGFTTTQQRRKTRSPRLGRTSTEKTRVRIRRTFYNTHAGGKEGRNDTSRRSEEDSSTVVQEKLGGYPEEIHHVEIDDNYDFVVLNQGRTFSVHVPRILWSSTWARTRAGSRLKKHNRHPGMVWGHPGFLLGTPPLQDFDHLGLSGLHSRPCNVAPRPACRSDPQGQFVPAIR